MTSYEDQMEQQADGAFTAELRERGEMPAAPRDVFTASVYNHQVTLTVRTVSFAWFEVSDGTGIAGRFTYDTTYTRRAAVEAYAAAFRERFGLEVAE